MIHHRTSTDFVYGIFFLLVKHSNFLINTATFDFSDIMMKMTSLHPCLHVTASLCTSVSDNWLGGAQVAQTFIFCKLLKNY